MIGGADNCFHLTVDIVLEIHAEAIEQFGGSAGIRKLALLESAVAAPQAGFAGKSVYLDIPDVAAAYLFYLCSNQPFIDGNKRAALGACIVFLRVSGYETAADGHAWEDLTFGVASGELDREQTTLRLRDLLADPA